MSRDEIIAATRAWLGTPYRHQHSVKGLGTDCLGLLRGVYRDVYGHEPETPPAYSPRWDEVERRELMLGAARRHLTEVAVAQPGDVLVFRMRFDGPAKHCGIMVAPTRMIHAHQKETVAEAALVPYWVSRIVGRFSFPGVE